MASTNPQYVPVATLQPTSPPTVPATVPPTPGQLVIPPTLGPQAVPDNATPAWEEPDWTSGWLPSYDQVAGATGSAASWVGDKAGKVGQAMEGQARVWLSTSAPPQVREECLHAFNKGMADLFTCVSRYPDQFYDQQEQRCGCFFSFRKKMREETTCEGITANFTAGVTNIDHKWGQITLEHTPNMTNRCRQYWKEWSIKHEASLWQLISDRWQMFYSEHLALCQFIFILAATALLIFICFLSAQYLLPCIVGKDLNAITKEWCDEDAEKAASREVEFKDAGYNSEEEDSSERQEESETWHGWIMGGVHALFEKPEEPEHYDMLLEGRSLRELRQGDGEPAPAQASSSLAAPAPKPPADWYNPPYFDPNTTTPEGHSIVHANPEMLQRQALQQAVPPAPHNVGIPFPQMKAEKPRGRDFLA